MTQQEFEQRTGFVTTPEMYAEIENEYMSSELDKDKFCKVWVKQGGIEEMSTRMAAQIRNLRNELAEEQRKREAEREHAEKELLEALIKGNAYAQEICRIFNCDDKAMRSLLNKLEQDYKTANGYK